MNSKALLSLTLFSIFGLSGCGGSDTTTGGAGGPVLSNKCTISNLQASSGTSSTLNKSSSSLSASFVLNLTEPLMVDIRTDFESSAADDWIKGYPYVKSMNAGDNNLTVTYDLQSPMKDTADRYTKLSVTALLPGNEACKMTMPVDILLEP